MQYFLGFETIGFVSVIALEYADGEMILECVEIQR